jgi:hypothetical protein
MVASFLVQNISAAKIELGGACREAPMQSLRKGVETPISKGAGELRLRQVLTHSKNFGNGLEPTEEQVEHGQSISLAYARNSRLSPHLVIAAPT